MNFDWQNLVVYLLIAAASTYVLRGLWRLVGVLRGGASGKQNACGNCGSCGSASTGQPVVIDLQMPAPAAGSSGKKTSGGL